jgi:hypothetical protein
MNHEVTRNVVGAIRHIKDETNNGMIEIDVVDDRFLIDSYDYIVNRSFNQIDDAVSSQINILQLAAQDAFSNPTSENRYLTNLNNLVNIQSNSPEALRAKVSQLENQLEQYKSLYKSAGVQNKKLERRINALRWESNNLKDTLSKI